jgi:hypothetical protein
MATTGAVSAATQAARFAGAGLTASQIAGVNSGIATSPAGSGATYSSVSAPAAKPQYSGTSAVDAVSHYGGDSSFSSRSNIAKSLGISNYSGTASQNIQLVSLLNQQGGLPTAGNQGVLNNSGAAQGAYNENVNTLNTLTGANQQSSEINQLRNDIQAQSANFQTQYAALQSKHDASYNRQLANISSSFDLLKTQMAESNSRYEGSVKQNQYSINGFRYSPNQAEGLVHQAEVDGLNKLAENEAKRAELISKAEQAKLENDHTVLNETIKLVHQNTADRLNIIQEIRTQQKQIADDVRTSQASEIKNTTAAIAKIKAQFPVIYDSVSKNPSKAEQFFQALATSLDVDIETVKGTYENIKRERGIQDTKLAQSAKSSANASARLSIAQQNAAEKKANSSPEVVTKTVNGQKYKKVSNGWEAI